MTWPGSLEGGRGISMASSFGPEATRSRSSGLKRSKSGSTFKIRSSSMPREGARMVNSKSV